MRAILLGCICALLANEVSAAIFVLIRDGAYAVASPTPSTNLNFKLHYENTDSSTLIDRIWIVNPTDLASTPNDCKFAYDNPGGVKLYNIQVNAADPNNKILSVDGTVRNCYFVRSSTTSEYTFTFMARTDDTLTNSLDTFYTHTATGTQYPVSLFEITNTAVQAFPPFPLTTITAANYNPVLQIFAASSPSAPATVLALGDAAFLRVTITIPNYVQHLDDEGVRVTTCEISQTSSFAVKRAIVDADGCFTENLSNFFNNTGFVGSTSNSGTTRTFQAVTQNFAVFNLVIENTTGNKDLFFRCNIAYCSDATITTAGNCGGNHCSRAKRRKREDSENEQVVTASVRIVRDVEDVQDVEEKQTKQAEDRCPNACDMGVAYKAAIGGLSGVALFLLAGMVLSYKSVMHVYEERRERFSARDQQPSTMSASTKSGTGSVLTSASGMMSSRAGRSSERKS